MKFIKYDTFFGKGVINASHLVELKTEQTFIDGKPLDNFGVTAQLSFGMGSRVLFIGSKNDCAQYIDNLIKEVNAQ